MSKLTSIRDEHLRLIAAELWEFRNEWKLNEEKYPREPTSTIVEKFAIRIYNAKIAPIDLGYNEEPPF